MCSIGVMLGSPDVGVLKKINELQAHRGPDGSNIWYDGKCGVAHNRLAIVDVEGSIQPIISDEGAVLVHNGEVYNQTQIKKENKSYNWKTKGDSESILALYSKYSKKSFEQLNEVKTSSGILVSKGFNSENNPATSHNEWVSKLDGIWGFAIWDSKCN